MERALEKRMSLRKVEHIEQNGLKRAEEMEKGDGTLRRLAVSASL